MYLLSCSFAILYVKYSIPFILNNPIYLLPVMDVKLKEKQKGRNQDINVKDMSNYTNIKKQLAEKEKKLDKANKQTNKLDNTTKDINQILDNLKPAKFNKNNMVISNEDIEKIKNFTKNVKKILLKQLEV